MRLHDRLVAFRGEFHDAAPGDAARRCGSDDRHGHSTRLFLGVIMPLMGERDRGDGQ